MPASFRMPGLSVLLSLALAACGGGGSGERPRTPQSLSGTVGVTSNTATDSDLNDPDAPYSANDDFSTAQMLHAPGLLGGYVNAPGAGPAGRSHEAGDPVDVYAVRLATGMQVVLTGASPEADLDLYLYDAADTLTPADSSVGPGPRESLQVAADGDYYLVVEAVSGASVYTLSIDRAGGPEAAGLRLSDEFVPGEALVRFHESSGGRAGTAEGPTARSAQATEAGSGPVRLTLTPPSSAPVHRSNGRSGARSAAASSDRRLHEKLDTLLSIKALRQQPDVELAEPNYLRRPLAVPNDPYFPLQWSLPQLNLPQAWDYTSGVRPGEPVRIALLDTGVVTDHPDLHGVLLPGYDFVSKPEWAGDGDGIDPDPSDPGDRAADGSSFHGTYVAGIIAARGNNGLGVTGVSWGARLLPVRVLGIGGGTSYDIMQGLRYAAGMSNDSGTYPSQPAEIINLSLGGSAHSQLEQELLGQLREQGIIVVAAAGNDGVRAPFYPAAYDGVLGVSALDSNGEPTSYSNRGDHVDLAAPGGELSMEPDGILSTGAQERDGGLRVSYFYTRGSSMAAAHATGVISLMKAIAPDLTPAGLDSLLAAGRLTTDLGAPGWDEYSGHGLLDAHRAVLAAIQAAGDEAGEAQLVLHPARLDFGSASRSLLLRVEGSSGELELLDIEVSAPWLRLTPGRVNASGLGDYQIGVERGDLPPGRYRGNVRFESSHNEAELVVTMEVPEPLYPGDAGRLYVLLVDAGSGETMAQSKLESGRFHFDHVEPGRYYLIAGADADNDGYICGPGEACGAWPKLSSLQALPPDELDGRSLTVEFPVPPELRAASIPAPGFERLR